VDGSSPPTRAFSVPLTARPVGTTLVATTRSSSGSRATTRRAPEAGRSVRIRDQNVTARPLGSPEATPSSKSPGPIEGRRLSRRPAQAGGTAVAAAVAPSPAISSRRVERLTGGAP
jgi:hypothetical protein